MSNELARGEHAGFKWIVRHNSMGFRCGYVVIPEGHPWHGKDYNSIEADCHGGLTYGESETDGYAIGFDCAHSGDAPDQELPGAARMIKYGFGAYHGSVKSQRYVERQCESLCEQARAVGCATEAKPLSSSGQASEVSDAATKDKGERT